MLQAVALTYYVRNWYRRGYALAEHLVLLIGVLVPRLFPRRSLPLARR